MVIASVNYAAGYGYHIGGYEENEGFIMRIYKEIPLTEFDFRAGGGIR